MGTERRGEEKRKTVRKEIKGEKKGGIFSFPSIRTLASFLKKRKRGKLFHARDASRMFPVGLPGILSVESK